ncbi:MAG: hypothetical protein OXE84_12205 [Rhodobacteraceae bacterium]|nr:hypothetical protein [Paracoccaceae bacterium]MCY4198037.1 hypothetical protein [Paracoccaceae bacterium]MCY4328153.1 hypothetical protein [Paracoccaceae bacterium]
MIMNAFGMRRFVRLVFRDSHSRDLAAVKYAHTGELGDSGQCKSL